MVCEERIDAPEHKIPMRCRKEVGVHIQHLGEKHSNLTVTTLCLFGLRLAQSRWRPHVTL